MKIKEFQSCPNVIWRNQTMIFVWLLLMVLSPFSRATETDKTMGVDMLVTKLTDLLREHYVIRSRVEELANSLEKKRDGGEYRLVNDRKQLAKMLTKDMRAVANDKHLSVRVIEAAEASSGAGSLGWEALERHEEIESNFGFSSVQILDGNVGYVRITEFREPQRSLETAIAAMRFTQNTRALIFDLRGNHGGYGGIAEYLASYFFPPEPTLLTKVQLYGKDPAMELISSLAAVVGERRLKQPLLILVDKETGSAAEWFAYTLQSFKKAKVVGEVTGGAAYMASRFDLAEGMQVQISTAVPLSAANNKNWEGVGVVPDIPCKPEDALEVAAQLARQQVKE